MSRRNPAFFVTYDLGLLIYLAFEGASFLPHLERDKPRFNRFGA